MYKNNGKKEESLSEEWKMISRISKLELIVKIVTKAIYCLQNECKMRIWVDKNFYFSFFSLNIGFFIP